MKCRFIRFAVLFFAFVACNKTARQENTCLALLQNTYSEGNYTMSVWNRYHWMVLPDYPSDESQQTYRAEFLLLDGEDSDLQIIKDKIAADLGKPFAQDITTPNPLYQYDISLFALPNNRDLDLEHGEHLYWWQTDEYVIRLFEANSHIEVGLPPIAIISLYNKKLLPKTSENK